MAKTVMTGEGDVLDALVYRATGQIAGSLETTLDANPKLAKLPDVLPAGVNIDIPDAAFEQPARPTFKLWE